MYRERQRLADIQAPIDAVRSHLLRGDLSDDLVFDAVRIRLLEIGEAVKALPAEMLSSQPGIPWSQIARMRDHLAHRYFDTDHAILWGTVQVGVAVVPGVLLDHVGVYPAQRQGGTDASASCSPVSPAHFHRRVERCQSRKPSRMPLSGPVNGSSIRATSGVIQLTTSCS